MSKLFIVDYTHATGSGTKVIRAKSHSSLRDRLWLCHTARITEVKPTRAWRWSDKKFEVVSPRVDLVSEAEAESINV